MHRNDHKHPAPRPQAPRARDSKAVAAVRTGSCPLHRACLRPRGVVLVLLFSTACRRSPLPEFDSATEGSTSPTASTSGTSNTSDTETEQPLCGNSITDEENGEECDDGNNDNTDDCLDTCVYAHCGDTYIHDGVEFCDYGDIENGDGCSSACQLEYTVFITAQKYSGDMSPPSSEELTSLELADANCQQQADSVDLAGQYKAWLSDSDKNPANRFDLDDASGDFLLVDGTLIAESWPELLDGGILAPIDIDQYGDTTQTFTVWTGTDLQGASSGENCEMWTSLDSAKHGALGLSTSTTTLWTYSDMLSTCSNPRHIYCFQVTEAAQ